MYYVEVELVSGSLNYFTFFSLNKNKKKLSEIGVNYDFAPVDIPEALLNDIVKQEKEDNKTVKEETKPKKAEKLKQEQKEDKKVVNKEKVAQNVKHQPNEGKGKKNNRYQKDINAAEVPKKSKSTEAKKEIAQKVNKKEKVPVKVNDKQQKEKEQILKKAGVKPAEFIKVGEESGDDSDSDYEFDSDAYDKLLEKMSENSELSFLSDEDDESDVDGEESEDEDR